jgi:hypothetical protein
VYAARLPAAGLFELFLDQEGHTDQFRFGQEADGTPATPWAGTDLRSAPARVDCIDEYQGWPVEESSISAVRFE